MTKKKEKYSTMDTASGILAAGGRCKAGILAS